jgi:hypothetical protein
MDQLELEGLAVATYERHGLDPALPTSTAKLARLELGEGAVVRAALTTSGPAATFWHNGARRIAIRRGLPLAYALFYVGHELAHVLLEREGAHDEQIEAACDYLSAALIAPRPAAVALYRAFGDDVSSIAEKVCSTQTWAALRVIGEVRGEPLAAISPKLVRVRGPESWVWPDASTIRSWARRGRPGLRKVEITDGRGRVALVAGEDG